MPLFEVARLAGHSSTKLIEERYGHLAPGAHDRASAILSATVLPQSERN